ncbi:MAG: flagellar basal body-associated FliL family protein [Xanthomonadaceae bacterium]|nr:flagellar basal body-associated FliL family protein [Xanthomonadaceae bacterium]
MADEPKTPATDAAPQAAATPETPAATPATATATAAPAAEAPAAEAPAGFGPEGTDAPKKVEKPKAAPIAKRVGLFGAVGESINSEKTHVKIWGWIFIASMLGLIVSSVGIFNIWMRYRASQAEIKKQQEISPEELAKKAEAEKKRLGEEYLQRNLNLGVFQFQMKKLLSEPEPRDIQNIAQMEVTILCDSLATKAYISSHMNEVRDQISQALIGFSRKDLMSSAGKQSIQEKILIKINVSLPDGRVERVFFTKLILS